jgi:hypothetical protein
MPSAFDIAEPYHAVLELVMVVELPSVYLMPSHVKKVA